MVKSGKEHTDKRVTEGSTAEEPTKAIVVVPVLTVRDRRQGEDAGTPRQSLAPQAKLEEAMGLAEAIDLDIVHRDLFNLSVPRPATLIGAGKVEELARIARSSSNSSIALCSVGADVHML